MKRNSGQSVAMVVIILMFFSLAIISITFYLHHESLWTLKEKRSTTAFHLAEAGVDRAYWKLTEDPNNFDKILNGEVIPLYDGTTSFADVSGGEYKIWITSDTEPNTIKIISVGRDNSKNEIRAIEVKYRKEKVEAAIQADGVFSAGNFDVHWGPILATEQLSATSKAYPVKRSKLGISGSSAFCKHSNHNLGRPDTTPPSSNSTNFCFHSWYPPGWYEWQNYDDSVNLPTVDLATLKQRAISQGRYYTSNQNWTNTNDGFGNAGESYTTYFNNYYGPSAPDPNCNTVRYFENASLKVAGKKYLEGTLVIVNGNLEVVGTDNGDYWWPVPPNAWKQYCAINTALANEWPGDEAGMPTPTGAPQKSQIRFGDYGNIGFHGVVYIQNGNMKLTGNVAIHGLLIVKNGTFSGAGTATVYFDPEVQSYSNIIAPLIKVSWREIYIKEF
ncbi:MAG: hypothetical protein QXO21_06020 [Candidatus Anstonellales archaeon]